MLLLAPVLVALALAVLRGGSFSNLADLPLRGISLVALGLALQIVLYLPGVRTAPAVATHGGVLYLATLVPIVVGALRNWRLGLAARVATLGLLLNTLVIAANGGHMPTNGTAMRAVRGPATVRDIADRRHFDNTHLATPATRLVALSDIIPVPFPPGAGNVYSVGDVLLAAGIAALAYQATWRTSSTTATGTSHHHVA
jgi:hypothetical protein